ncbi:MAG: 4-alpha-glucanotransferase, partial [Planctomycetes bacterium]|nr:4-alpha-glucanotransferase [Planctomycetota bacterium]
HTPDNVVYTGTHDNDTTIGWLRGEDLESDLRGEEQCALERQNFLNYINTNGNKLEDLDACWQMIALALGSVAKTAIIPLQDILGLDSSSRMNRPGTQRLDNWAWRMTPEQLDEINSPKIHDRLRTLLWRYGRL